MTLDHLLARLVRMYRQPIDDATAADYRCELADVPIPLLEAAVTRAIRTRTYLPNVAEVRADVEACRTSAQPTETRYEPCDRCAETPGWMEITDTAGVRRMQRCVCWQERRQAQGLALTASKPTLEYDEDHEAPGLSSTRELAARSKVARFKQRVSGGGR